MLYAKTSLSLTAALCLCCLYGDLTSAAVTSPALPEPAAPTTPPPANSSAHLMNELVNAHFTRATLREVLDYLTPSQWRIQSDLPEDLLSRQVVFHAETTRRRALDDLLSGLNLKGFLYPQAGILFIHKIR